jgi:predicted branched-subunit amino acid permease
VSTRNLLLGMAMTHHFDGHSLRRRIAWLFLLNDPGVVNSFRQQAEVDRLGYVTGYGLSMMTSWLCSTLLGLQTASLFVALDLGAVKFAGPLVIATMMMLFFKGAKTPPTPWIVSGIAPRSGRYAAMLEQQTVLAAIAMMALIVYLTRITGYFIGLQLRHFMAILAPAVRQGSPSEMVAMACVILIMWRSNNVVLATGVGMAVLLFGGPWLDAP